jgi:hypothetical protein
LHNVFLLAGATVGLMLVDRISRQLFLVVGFILAAPYCAA